MLQLKSNSPGYGLDVSNPVTTSHIEPSLRLPMALDTIDLAFRAKTLSTLHSVIHQCLTRFGVDYFGVDRLQGSKEAVAPLYGCSHQPWAERYLSQEYYRHDRIVQHAVSQIAPVQWQSVQTAEDLTSGQKLIFGEASDFGLKDGLCTPVWKADGTIQSVTFISTNHLQLSLQDLATLRLVALYYVSLGEKLWRNEIASTHTGLLTPMQKECLNWVRAGKTNWEIGSILSISERTVKFHIKNACDRLGVYNRTQAVIEATVRGEIGLD